MILNKKEYETIKGAALKIAPELSTTFQNIEEKEKEKSKKTSLYILEKRKINKFYCR